VEFLLKALRGEKSADWSTGSRAPAAEVAAVAHSAACSAVTDHRDRTAQVNKHKQ